MSNTLLTDQFFVGGVMSRTFDMFGMLEFIGISEVRVDTLLAIGAVVLVLVLLFGMAYSRHQ